MGRQRGISLAEFVGLLVIAGIVGAALWRSYGATIKLQASGGITPTSEFVVNNEGRIPWRDCTLTLNGGYRYSAASIPVGRQVAIPIIQFVDAEGRRFQLLERDVTHISMVCDTEEGRGAWSGDLVSPPVEPAYTPHCAEVMGSIKRMADDALDPLVRYRAASNRGDSAGRIKANADYDAIREKINGALADPACAFDRSMALPPIVSRQP